MNSIRFHVSGIRNSQIKTALKNALDKIEGVQAVDIDKTLGRVDIAFNAPADSNALQMCVLEAGLKLQ